MELQPQPAGELDVTLAAAIARRRTDRRNYSSWPVPGGDIALMGARAARGGHAAPDRPAATTPRDRGGLGVKHANDSDYLAELNAGAGGTDRSPVPARNTRRPTRAPGSRPGIRRARLQQPRTSRPTTTTR